MLVLDATTGQNALVQAKAFAEVVPITALCLTKLDGTSKAASCSPYRINSRSCPIHRDG